MCAIWVRNREICYPGYETARENWVADTARPVTKPHELPLSGLCVRSAALRMEQEEASQYELVERCEAKRMVESGDGSWFCRLLRVYVRVKHFWRCFAKPEIWSSQIKAVLLSSEFRKDRIMVHRGVYRLSSVSANQKGIFRKTTRVIKNLNHYE